MGNFDDYFSGTLHFLFQSNVDVDSSRKDITRYILDKFDVLQLDVKRGDDSIQISSLTRQSNKISFDYMGFVEMLEQKLINGHRIAIIVLWSDISSERSLQKFAQVNDIVQRVASAREQWREGLKVIAFVDLDPMEFFEP